MEIAKRRVLYDLPALVEVRRSDDVDLYVPRGGDIATLPVVVIVSGFPDEGTRKHIGCSFREMQSTIDWAHLFAASGMIGVAWASNDPASRIHDVLHELRGRRIWASSGNVPVALSTLMTERVTCAVFCYGYMLDVAEAQATWGFANPCAGRTIDDLRADVPIFIARAGQDQFRGIHDSIDRFASAALARNLPLTLVNHSDGPHSFDLFHDSETTREIIRSILWFLQFHLEAAPGEGLRTRREASSSR